MRALLERWHAHESDRCRIGPPTSQMCADVKVGDDVYLVMFDRPSPKQLGLLLAAVIEAIESKGWTFSTHTATVTQLADGDTEGRIVERGYGATVFTWADGKPNSMGPAYSSLEPLDTPAAALLSAYLDALEAEQ